MATKMAASNITTAITSLLINLGTYFLGLIVLFQHISDMYHLHTMFVNPTWLPNGYRKQNMQHFINYNQMYMMMAYNETHLLHPLCALYTRYTTHSKHFSHYLGRDHHCDCPSLQHMHLSFAHGWSVVQPNMITLIISRGARAAPSGAVTGSNDFESSSFSHPSLLISTRSGWSFLTLPSRLSVGNAPASHFAGMLRMLEGWIQALVNQLLSSVLSFYSTTRIWL